MEPKNLVNSLSIFSTSYLLPLVEEKSKDNPETAERVRLIKANLSSIQPQVRETARVFLIAIAVYLLLKE